MPTEQRITQLQNFILFSFVPTRHHKKKKEKKTWGIWKNGKHLNWH
jgi:hypothetical protein